jgi:hypothetical protein
MTDRKLASIQRIVSLDPIPDADKIQKATVLGWEVVVAKSENHQVGDLVCYIEVDSIVPDRPEFEFLRERKFRVRTIKLRKQVSQGLIMPLTILPGDFAGYQEGSDVTNVLGIKKYDPEGDKEQKLLDEKAARSKNKLNKFLLRYPWYRRLFSAFMPKKASWPKFIKKTDEDRIQLFPGICEREKDTFFQVTEKLDGQSATYFLVKNKKKFLWFGEDYIFGVCSRNLLLPKPDNSSYWTIAKQLNIKDALLELIGDNDYVVLQGEIIGEGIQGNKYKIKGYSFYAFNLIFPTLSWSASEMKALNFLGIKQVPLLTQHFRLKPTIPENVEYAKGKSEIADTLREGVVVRNYGKNISFKIINPDFLLKFEE